MRIIALALVLAASSVACASSPRPSVANARPAPLPPFDDAQIAELERDAARTDIAEATLAHALARDPAVRNFANHLEADDRALTDEETRTLERLRIAPASSDASEALDIDRRDRLDALRPQFGTAFDLAFVDSQIEHDRQVLSLIDSALLRAVKSRPVRRTLLDARPVVAMHLEEAERLHERLAAK